MRIAAGMNLAEMLELVPVLQMTLLGGQQCDAATFNAETQRLMIHQILA